KIIENGNFAASSIKNLGAAIGQVNEGLGDTISQFGDVVSIATDSFSSITSFASGDYIGGVTSGISAITGILGFGAKAAAERKQRIKDATEFYAKQFTGEFEVNQLVRERLRLTVLINEAR